MKKLSTGPSIRCRRRHNILWDGCCLFVASFTSFIYVLIIKGELFSCLYDVLIPPICFFICKGWELLCEHNKQSLAVLLFVLETLALYLDICGRNNLGFLATAVLLSAFIFSITMQAGGNNNGSRNTATNDRSSQEEAAQRQLRAIEYTVSLVQMLLAILYSILAVTGYNINSGWSIVPLICAAIGVAFAFKYGTEAVDRAAANDQPNHQQPAPDLEQQNANGIAATSADATQATISSVFTDQTGDSLV